MSDRPRLLDLFCGAGGAAMGYHRAGFDVVGVDIKPQPSYPFPFVQADALAYPLDGFDAIHASPPCQRYSHALKFGNRDRERHPDFIAATRRYVRAASVPYIIENVEGARSLMEAPWLLCGSMVGLPVRRHRLFETSFPLLLANCQHGLEALAPQVHLSTTQRDGKRYRRGIVNAHASGATWNTDALREAMDVPWIAEKVGVREAIPPRYTELIGYQLLAYL